MGFRKGHMTSLVCRYNLLHGRCILKSTGCCLKWTRDVEQPSLQAGAVRKNEWTGWQEEWMAGIKNGTCWQKRKIMAEWRNWWSEKKYGPADRSMWADRKTKECGLTETWNKLAERLYEVKEKFAGWRKDGMGWQKEEMNWQKDGVGASGKANCAGRKKEWARSKEAILRTEIGDK